MADPLHAARAAGSSLASMGRRRLDDLLDVLDLLLERQNGHLTPAQREQIAARASADKASRDSFAAVMVVLLLILACFCLLYTSPSPRDQRGSRMPSSA